MFGKIGMEINLNKSSCLRIGNRHNYQFNEIQLNNCVLKICQEIKYLGVIITSANIFKINGQNAKQKFFKALNCIFGRVGLGLNTSPVTLCSLIDHCCLPFLLYASESVPWNASMLRSFENAYTQAFFKIFQVSDKQSLQYCQFVMGCLPIELQIMKRKVKFLHTINASKNINLWNLSLGNGQDELESILVKYNIPKSCAFNSNRIFWKHFELLQS